MENENNDDVSNPKDSKKDDSEMVFQKVSEDLDPPIVNQMKNTKKKQQEENL